MDFVHLHVHTEYSLLDGATRIDKIFKRCDELGQSAIAITDHGNMFGVLEFFKQAVKYSDKSADPFSFLKKGGKFKVKPIIGCELYMCDDMLVKSTKDGKPKLNHIILLAKNKVGYHNLLKLCSLAYTEGMYYKPRIDFELLKKHSDGLICLSACLAGIIPQLLLNQKYKEAKEEAIKFKNIFADDYYIEIQDHNMNEQKKTIPDLLKLAKETKIKVVATNDVHYLNKEDAEMQKVLQCISYRTTIGERNEKSEDYFPTNEFYLKSGDEMKKRFEYCTDAINNSVEIANKCECDFFERQPLLPPYVPVDGSKPKDYLIKLAYDGLKKRLKTDKLPEERIKRLEYELNTIIGLGFVEYFLIVWDFIHYAEKNGISVGPGRGSGAGSLVAFSLGITKLDPQKYDLYFERFLNNERVSNPDFDIDFCVLRREEVIKYVTDKYGINNVSQIVTFGTLAAKAAIKDVCRVFSYPYSKGDAITKTMPKMLGHTHLEALIGKGEKPDPQVVCVDLKKMYDEDEDTRRIVDMAIRVEDLPRQTGMHAAGVLICKDPLSDHVPVMIGGEEQAVAQFDMIECEELGLLKMDFLGLNTLTDISKALELIEKTTGKKIDFYDMEYDDPNVFEMLGKGDTHGIFQLESAGMKSFLRELLPTTFEDIIAGIALYRPGPMDKIPDYVKGKRNSSNINYPHPLLEPILNVTYGVIVYQEQVMQIVRELAGYTLGRADIVRRLMSKKKAEDMAKEKETFLNGTSDKVICGTLAKGVPEDVASKVFEDMASFASYAFNKSHAAAYAYLTYQTAYLKYYYPRQFFASLLNNRITNIDEVANYLGYIKSKGIKVFPPSVNKSNHDFTIESDGVRVGMSAIKNVGLGFIEELEKEREKNGKYKNFKDFVTRLSPLGLNKKNLESMILTGCFDEYGYTRSSLINVCEKFLKRASIDRDKTSKGQFNMFGDMESDDAEDIDKIDEFDIIEKLKKEKEVAGVYLTGHPLSIYISILSAYEINSKDFRVFKSEINDDIDDFDENKLDTNKSYKIAGLLVSAERRFTKQNKEMGIGVLEDIDGTIDVVVWPNKYDKIKDNWKVDVFVELTGKPNYRENQCSFLVDEISIIERGTDLINKKNSETNDNNGKEIDMVDVSPQVACAIYLKDAQINDNCKLYQDVLEIIEHNRDGKSKCYIKNIDTNKLLLLPTRVEVCDAFRLELYALLGKDNVKIEKVKQKVKNE